MVMVEGTEAIAEALTSGRIEEGALQLVASEPLVYGHGPSPV